MKTKDTTKHLRIAAACGDPEAVNMAIKVVTEIPYRRFDEDVVIQGAAILERCFKRGRYDPTRSIKAFFYGILKKLKKYAEKLKGKRPEISQRALEAPERDFLRGARSCYPSPEDVAMASEPRDRVDAPSLIRHLISTYVPHHLRRIAELQYLEGRTPTEILGIMNKDPEFVSGFKSHWPRSELTLQWVRNTLKNTPRIYLGKASSLDLKHFDKERQGVPHHTLNVV